MMDSTQQTIQLLRRRGFMAEKVERWLHTIRQFRDLFKLFDVFTLKPGEGGVLIQSTEKGALAAHRRKLLGDPRLPFVLLSRLRVQLWCWSETVGPNQSQWDVSIEEAFLNEAGVPEFRVAKVPETMRQQNSAVELDYCI
jgi:hypothetical protein